MLEAIKSALGITGTYQDNTLTQYMNEVIQFLLDGGVDEDVINDPNNYGIVARGVADLWNYGSGGTSLSPYFIQRATQLSIKCKKRESEIAELEQKVENLDNVALVTEESEG